MVCYMINWPDFDALMMHTRFGILTTKFSLPQTLAYRQVCRNNGPVYLDIFAIKKNMLLISLPKKVNYDVIFAV